VEIIKKIVYWSLSNILKKNKIMKVASLYSLVKKINQQKGRKLKIICNINDVKTMKSSAAYGVSDKTFSFKKYHKIF